MAEVRNLLLNPWIVIRKSDLEELYRAIDELRKELFQLQSPHGGAKRRRKGRGRMPGVLSGSPKAKRGCK